MDRRAQGEATSTEHARRSWLELAGSIQGLETGYADEQEAATQRFIPRQLSGGIFFGPVPGRHVGLHSAWTLPIACKSTSALLSLVHRFTKT